MITKKILMILILSCSIMGSTLGLTLDKIPDSRLDVTAFCCDSSETRLFVGLQNASVWKSENGGLTWESLNSRICPSAKLSRITELFALDPNADTVFCKTENNNNHSYQYVFSINGGNNWEILNIESNFGLGHHLTIDNNNRLKFLHIDNKNISISEDFGETWETRIYDPRMNQKSNLVQHPDSNNVFYMTGFGFSDDTDGGVYRSEDYGRNWEPVFNAAEIADFDQVNVADVDILSNGKLIFTLGRGAIYSTNEYVFLNSIIVRNEENDDWDLLDVGLPQDIFSQKLVESIIDDGVLFIYGFPAGFNYAHGIFRSTDFGNSFQRIEEGLPPDLRYIQNIHQNEYNRTVYLLTQGYGVFKSLDGGFEWSHMDLNMGLGNAIEFSLINDNIFYRSYQSADHISKFNIQDNSSQDLDYPDVTGDTTIYLNPNIVENEGNIFTLVHKFSFDQEYSSFQIMESLASGGELMGIGEPIMFQDYSINHRDFYYNSNEILRILNVTEYGDSLIINTSIDTGRTWNKASFDSQFVGYWNMVAQTDDIIYMIVESEGILKSTDNGLTWANMDFPNSYDLANGNVYLLTNTVNNHLYLFGYYRLWLWDGEEWSDCGTSRSGAGNMQDFCLISEESPAFLATYWGANRIWYRPSLTALWENLEVEAEFLEESRNLVNVRYDAERERIWVSNHFGLYWFDIAQLGVKDQPIQLYPAGYEVLTTYPNPFNASTKIEFILEKTNDVSLKLYDINGRLVRKLLDEKRETGKHTLTLDGSQLASGTYFLRLDDGQQVHSRKLLLVK